jgi:hypothetical protein
MFGCLAGAAGTVSPINKQRQDLQITAGNEIGDESLPPWVAVATTALGPFRGLLVDIMWWRATRLKEEGKFYEANTLSQWITTMQPRFPVVWEFHAWNMAYNISVVTNTKEERWDWVSKGIRLLRDRGIRLNPRAIKLYRELSWIYFHKINEVSDDAHWYYKKEVTREWQEILGSPAFGLTTEQTIDTFRQISNAPKTKTEFIEKSPEAVALLSELKPLGYSIDKIEDRLKLLRTLGKMAMLNYLPQPIFTDYPMVHLPPDVPQEMVKPLIEIMQNVSHVPAITALLSHLRYRVLVDSYHMRPSVMLDCMKRFGPVDWRHPCAHSLYWAREATLMAEKLRLRHESQEIDYLNAYRQNIFSIQSLMRSGSIQYDPLTGYFGMQPDTRFIDSYEKIMEMAAENVKDDAFKKNIIDSFDQGHENFLLQSVSFCYIYGDIERAMKYFIKAKTDYGDNLFNKGRMTYDMGLEEWVYGYLRGNVDMLMNSRQLIDGALRRAISEGLRYGNLERWSHHLRLAQRVHKEWNEERVITNMTKQDRQKLPPIKQMLSEVYVNFMGMPSNHVIVRGRIWMNSPNDLRQATFERLRATLYRHAKEAGFVGEALFPVPKGYKPKSHEHQDADKMPETKKITGQIEVM